MKRLLSFALTAAFCASLLCGCTHTAKPSDTVPSSTAAETEAPDEKYVGTNGNYWLRNTDTGEKAQEMPLFDGDLAIYDDTISLAESRYFTSSPIEAGKTPLLLVGGFAEGLGFCRYSDVTLRSVEVWAEKAGRLSVSAASVSALSAGKAEKLNGSVSFELTEGLNTLSFDSPFTPGSDETVVLGAEGDTAVLRAFSDMTLDPGNGEAIVSGEGKTVTLPIRILAGGTDHALLLGKQIEGQKLTTVSQFGFSLAPFVYRQQVFGGAKITEIALQTAACKKDATFTVSVVKFGNLRVKNTVSKKVITAEEDLEAGWHRFPLSIRVPEDATLAFGSAEDTMPVLFFQGIGPEFDFYNNCRLAGTLDNVHCLGIDVYGTKSVPTRTARAEEIAKEIHLLPLTAPQLEQLKEKLSGKKVSLLGDSITTFQGISNNTGVNSTIGGNAVFYSTQIKVSDTWWNNIISATDTTLCVNNAFSGSEVWNGAGITYRNKGRAENLHNDRTGEEPDLIFVFMGTNDQRNDDQKWFVPFDEARIKSAIKEKADGTVTYSNNPQSFLEAYAITIHRMMRRYPDAQIVLMTMAPSYLPSDPSGAHLTRYAQLICDIGDYFGLPHANLVTDAGLSLENIAGYSIGDSLHPNKAGMKRISDCVLKTMYEFYFPKEG